MGVEIGWLSHRWKWGSKEEAQPHLPFPPYSPTSLLWLSWLVAQRKGCPRKSCLPSFLQGIQTGFTASCCIRRPTSSTVGVKVERNKDKNSGTKCQGPLGPSQPPSYHSPGSLYWALKISMTLLGGSAKVNRRTEEQEELSPLHPKKKKKSYILYFKKLGWKKKVGLVFVFVLGGEFG